MIKALARETRSQSTTTQVGIIILATIVDLRFKIYHDLIIAAAHRKNKKSYQSLRKSAKIAFSSHSLF